MSGSSCLAATYLWDRGWGRVGPEKGEEDAAERPRPDVSRLPPADREALVRILSKLGAEPGGGASEGD